MTRQTEWAPRPIGIAGCAVAGGVLAIASLTLAGDVAGRMLTGAAAVGLLMFAGISWHGRPKLAITADGLVVHGWLRPELLRPADIKAVRITEFRRVGRKVRLLEIETADEGLRVLSRWDLGTNPLEVLDTLTRAGYGPGQR